MDGIMGFLVLIGIFYIIVKPVLNRFDKIIENQEKLYDFFHGKIQDREK